jgi:hypothetical protein
MNTTVLPRRPGTGRGLRSTTELLDVNAKLGVATVKVDLTDITEVMAAARFAANALIGQLLAERLLGLDICPIESNLDVAISGRVSVIVRVSLATELPHLFAALRSNRVGNLAVDVVVLDGSFTEWARGRMEWSIRQRRCAEWPINSP